MESYILFWGSAAACAGFAGLWGEWVRNGRIPKHHHTRTNRPPYRATNRNSYHHPQQQTGTYSHSHSRPNRHRGTNYDPDPKTHLHRTIGH